MSTTPRTSSPHSNGDDRLLAPTRWTAAGVIPVLVAAFVILYVFPGRTQQLWAWMIRPEMSALFMGAGYLSGAYFFVRVVRGRSWHRVGAGFVGTTVFSSVLMLTTVLHWDQFNHNHVSFWAWLLLYAVTPPLLPLLWMKNQRTDPGVPAPGDVRIPRPLRLAVGAGGIAALVVAALMFLAPGAAADEWPWPLSDFTARSLSAYVAFPGVSWLWFLFDERWSSFRITQQTNTLGLVLITIAAVRARDDFTTDGRFWLYLVGLLVAVALHVVLFVAMERRAGGRHRTGVRNRGQSAEE